MALAKLSPPFPTYAGPAQAAIEHALGGGATLFSAPPGFLLTSRLAGLLRDYQAPVIWLRAGQEDRDPATLLVSLVGGAEAVFPGLGKRAFDHMRRRPGPIYGWAPLFGALANDLAAAATGSPQAGDVREHSGPPLVLVIQHIHEIFPAASTMALLQNFFLPMLPGHAASILISHSLPPRGLLPGYLVQRTVQDLRYTDEEALALTRQFLPGGMDLSLPSLRRLLALVEGCGMAVSALCSAYPLLGGKSMQHMVDSASSQVDLLARVARGSLQSAALRAPELLDLALRVEYLHPETIQAALEIAPGEGGLLPAGFDNAGWLETLNDSWLRLHCVWQNPIRQTLRPPDISSRQAASRAAWQLAQSGAQDLAIPLLMDLGAYQQAAQALQQTAEAMIDRGQWETLSGWLSRLPESVRRDQPDLLYAEAELAAAHGQPRAARQIFAAAAGAFTERSDYAGACQSLLNESILAANHKDLAQAQRLARQAQALASANGLQQTLAWANWQMACLEACAGRAGAAAAYLRAAGAASSNAPHLADFIAQTSALMQALASLQEQASAHRKAALDAAQAGSEAAERLHLFLQDPGEPARGLLEAYGWSKVPLSVKLPGSYAPAQIPTSAGAPSGARRMLELVRALLQIEAPDDNPAGAAEIPDTLPGGTTWGGTTPGGATGDLLLPVSGNDRSPESPALKEAPNAQPITPPVEQPQPLPGEPAHGSTSPPEDAPAGGVLPGANADSSAVGRVEPSAPESREKAFHVAYLPGLSPQVENTPTLRAYLLGKFRVTFQDVLLASWPGGRGRSVFTYLLAQRGQPTQRDLLMDTFWPDASPESARNSLNVAIYTLRRTLKNAFNFPVILFRDNAYRINPGVHIWTDVEDFEARVRTAGQLERNGAEISLAVGEYEQAVSLYQGDFLADSPYEEWAAFERERLRILHLDTLDHLSLVYFNLGQYAASISLCQRMLSHDACREDAHCRLMRCYTRQGQAHLAIRQYQACVEALHSEMDVGPALATVQLYEQIRRREMI